jgi:hypothetical protein
MAQLYDANGNPFLTDVVLQAQTLSSLNAAVSLQLRGQASAAFQVTAIGSQTLTFEGSVDGANFFTVNAYPIGGGASVTSTTTTGQWTVDTAGMFIVRLRVSTQTSGSATVSGIASQGTGAQTVVAAGVLNENLTQWASTTLGVPTNFGTTPGAVIAGSVNSSTFIGTVAAVAASAGVQKVGVSGATGVTLDAANGASVPANGVLVGGGSVAGGTNFEALTVKAASTAAAATDTSLVVQPLVGSAVMSTAAAGVQKVGISGATAVTLDAANGASVPANGLLVGGGSVAGGTNFEALTVKAASTAAAATDTSLVVQPLVGSAVMSTAASGVQKVGISGATAATLDSTTTVATTPANGVAVTAANVTTAPSLATGQSVALQCDYQGSVYVKPYRRGQTAKQATTISATGATTILAAQASGIFADISTLIISTTPQATTASQFTFTLSDGTNSYIFDLIAQVTTANGTTPPLVLTFDPPLPATSAATAWTGNISATNTVHVTVVAALQKAS